jgi:hypothetical protein
MDQSAFWRIIEQAEEASGGDLQYQVELVKNSLRTLPLADIETFERIYQEFYYRSYSTKLWDAMIQLAGFVSDDGFDYFRDWLISRGEPLYCEVVQHPQQVHEFVDLEDEWELESLHYAAEEVYEEKAGRSLSEVLRERKVDAYRLVGYEWLPADPGRFP